MLKVCQLLLLQFVSIAASYGATISGGTAAILVRTPSKVSVAVDSKEVYRSSQPGQMRVAETCAQKLRRVGNYVAVVAGFSRGSNGYDALEFIESQSKPSYKLDDLMKIAQNDLGVRFQGLLRDLVAAGINVETFHKRDEPAIQIGFIGAEDGVTRMGIVQLFVDDPSGNTPLRTSSARCPGDCGANTYAFLLGTHAEMNAALVATPKLLKGITTEAIRGLVALEETSHPDVVGGPISTATISSTGDVRVDIGQCGPITENPDPRTTVGEAAVTGSADAISIDSLRSILEEQLARMADLQCHRTVHRFVTTPVNTRYLDNIDFDIELHTGGETYTHIKRKNKEYRDVHDLPGSWYSGDLATVLSVTSAALMQSSNIQSRNANEAVAKFNVPAGQHQWYMIIDGTKHWMDIAGTVTVAGGMISGIEWTGTNLPWSLGIRQIKLKVTFSGASIAEKTFRVPDSSVFAVEYQDTMIGTALDVSDFSNFRRLGATSSLSF